MRLFRHVSAFFIALVALTGCSTFQKAKFNAGNGVGQECVLVVPFSEPQKSLWYGESKDGVYVSEAVKAWAHKNTEPIFCEAESAERILHSVLEWSERRITSAQWQKLTAGSEVRYVVYGELSHLTLTRDDQIGLIEPSVDVAFHVVDVQGPKPRLLYETKATPVEYGRGREADFPIVELGANTEDAKRRLLAKVGSVVAKDLYGYYPE